MTTTASGSATSGPASCARRLDAVELGHPDVEQAHVGPQLAGQRHGLTAVGRLADHLDVGLGVEDHAQPGPDDLLVVGDEHADGHRGGPLRGSTAPTVQPRSGPGPASRVPPSSVARSVMPDEAVARRAAATAEPASPSSSHRQPYASRSSGDPHVDRGWRAGRAARAFVTDSWASR